MKASKGAERGAEAPFAGLNDDHLLERARQLATLKENMRPADYKAEADRMRAALRERRLTVPSGL